MTMHSSATAWKSGLVLGRSRTYRNLALSEPSLPVIRPTANGEGVRLPHLATFSRHDRYASRWLSSSSFVTRSSARSSSAALVCLLSAPMKGIHQ